jgi:ParB family chromosome partitioning protein
MSIATSTQPLAPPANGKTVVPQKSGGGDLPTAVLTAGVNLTISKLEARDLPLAKLIPSKTNPRKNFEGPAMDELVESIRSMDVLQPVLVRPWKSKGVGDVEFEIVAGERRYRASQKAGKPTIPAIVRELTDDQVLEIQIVENLQREDVTAIEESRGYVQLFNAIAKAEPKKPKQEIVASIAKKIGKSVRYVYARMKLSQLEPQVLAFLDKGTIDASHCDLMVSLQPADQLAALKYVSGETRGDYTLSVRALKKWIGEELVRNLSSAPWKKDDAKLLPKAGACSGCEKRTGAHPELHPDVKAGQDLCLDRACFAEKKNAFVQIQVRVAEAEARGSASDAGKTEKEIQKLKLTEALRISPLQMWESELERGEKQDGHILFAGESWSPTYVLVKEGECEFVRPAVLVEGPETGHKRLVCVEYGCKKHYKHPGGITRSVHARPGMAERKTERARKLAEDAKYEIAAETLRQIQAKAPTSIGKYELDLIAWSMWSRLWHDRKREVAKYLGLEPVKKQHSIDFDTPERAHLDGFKTAQELIGFILLMCLAGAELGADRGSGPEAAKARLEIAKRLKVNVEAIEKRINAESRERLKRLNDADEAKEAKEREANQPAVPKRPETQLEREIFHALHHMEDADKRWALLRLRGASDAEIKTALRDELGLGGGICADDCKVEYKGGSNPFIKPSKRPKLTGAKLIKAVRDLTGIRTFPAAQTSAQKQAAVRKPEPAKKGASPKKAQAKGKKGGRK